MPSAPALNQSPIYEDIDLFTTPAGGGTAPNILIILDNSANWSRNDQAWAIGKQGESELRSLWSVMGDASVKFLKFLIDMDSDRLKRPRRRIFLVMRFVTTGAADDTRKFARPG